MREGIRLSSRHRLWLFAGYAALVVTGLAWLGYHHFGVLEGEFGPERSPWEPRWLAAHGAAAMAFLVLLGTLLRGHLPRGWRSGRNRASGIGLVAANSMLVATGWGLYYAGGESTRPLLSAAHWSVGLLVAAVLCAHAWPLRRPRAFRRTALTADWPPSPRSAPEPLGGRPVETS